MREMTWRQSNQSKKAAIVSYYYQWQILKHSEKEREGASQCVKTPKGTEEKTTLKGSTGMTHLCGSTR
jgi:hypothetical protein